MAVFITEHILSLVKNYTESFFNLPLAGLRHGGCGVIAAEGLEALQQVNAFIAAEGLEAGAKMPGAFEGIEGIVCNSIDAKQIGHECTKQMHSAAAGAKIGDKGECGAKTNNNMPPQKLTPDYSSEFS